METMPDLHDNAWLSSCRNLRTFACFLQLVKNMQGEIGDEQLSLVWYRGEMSYMKVVAIEQPTHLCPNTTPRVRAKRKDNQ